MKLKLLLSSGLLYLSSLSFSQTIPTCTYGNVGFTQSGTGSTRTCTSSSTGFSSPSYIWKYNGTTVGSSSSQSFTFSTTGPNMVCLTIIDITYDSIRMSVDTCQKTFCDSLTGGTPPPPPPGPCSSKSISFTKSVTGSSATFTATHPGYGSSNVSWYDGTTNIGTGSNLTTTLTPGLHMICAKATIIIFDSSGRVIDTCFNQFCDSINIMTSTVIENNLINSINVFPNPATNNVTMSYNSNVSIKGTLIITDLIGKIVFNKNIDFKSNTKSEERLDISSLSKGSYLIRIINTKSENYISKPIRFVKQ